MDEDQVVGTLEVGTLREDPQSSVVVGTFGDDLEVPDSVPEMPEHLRFAGGQVGLAEAEDDKRKARRFAMRPAYSGGEVMTWWGRMIVDLAGMRLGAQRKPILREHYRHAIVGYSTHVKVEDHALGVEGTLSKVTQDGQEVEGLGDEGFPWQASMGFDIHRHEILEDGDSKEVNGRTFRGPGIVITKSTLREASFVSLGADQDAAGVVLADSRRFHLRVVAQEETMTEPQETADRPEVEEAGALAEADSTRLAALREAFPGRADFVLDQFVLGHDVDQAKADLVPVLEEEQAATREELAQAREENADLQARLEAAEDGHDGVGFTAGEGAEPAEPAADDVETRAAQEWAANQNEVRAEFGSQEEYTAYLRANERGSIRILRKEA